MYIRKRKLIWHIFPSFLIIILGSLIFSTWYATQHFKHFFIENSEKELTIQARLLQHKFTGILDTAPQSITDMDRLCKKIGETVHTRVTIILPSGEVVGDSFGRIETMENHRDRPEIQTALNGNKGVSVRYSATLDQNMMYIALPLLNGNTVRAVVRTAVSISTIDQSIHSVRNNIFFTLIFIVLVAVAASLIVSRRISRPVEEMKQGAQEFARGNLNNRLAVPDTEELSELARAMNTMAESLDDKIKDSINRRRELEAVHTSMQEGVIAIDNQERIITINAAASKIFDFSASTLKNRNILEVARNFELQTFIQRALSTHEPVEDDIQIHRGEEIILNIHSTALWDTGEKRMGTLIIFHDITRIRRLENMHKDFAANVSHELKTPLTSIKGFIETLQEMVKRNDTQESLGFMKIIDKNVNRMIDLINDLLALSRLERLEGTDIHLEEHPMSALIAAAVNLCRTGWEEKNIAIEVDCPASTTALVDPILMEQALVNLVDNAIKYSPEGARVEVDVTTADDGLQILVKDQGAGIPAEHLPRLFERFYRVDKARSRKLGGTGLGLAIVKHIAQA
ncbi:MAG: ATP-binding protein, partial [Desulfobacterales bacterium]|nr:ATP-binding protein [Desulfobacterales bacterium]